MQFIRKKEPTSKAPQNVLRIIPLGGCGTVTKSMFIYEYQDDILIVDCGTGFPDEAMLGVDLVIPDISYLVGKTAKIRGIILTHGHDDHIGAVAYLWEALGKPPIYSTKLTLGLLGVRLEERGLKNAKLNVVLPSQSLSLGVFKVNFFHVTHSIPDAVNLVIETPVGIIVHATDFKFDWTPVDGKPTEVAKIVGFAQKGILALLSESTRVESSGYTLSEKVISQTFQRAMAENPGRVLITTYASSISRIQQAIWAAQKTDRRVSIVGRSMDQNTRVARELGYLFYPNGFLIAPQDIEKTPPRRLVLLVSGSQGQPGSALSRIANSDHRFVKIKVGDLVIFSADPIPGHESAVHAIIDQLTRHGANVEYTEITDNLHVSGHGAREDLKMMIALVRPKFFVPIHGNPRHLKLHADLAQEMGIPRENIFIDEEGGIIELWHDGAHLGPQLDIKNVMVDGLGIGDVGNVVLRDRQQLAEDGIVMVVVPVDQSRGMVVGQPDIFSRGFVYMKEAGELIDEAKEIVKKTLGQHPGRVSDWHFLRRRIEEDLEKFLYDKTQRRPMILPVVVEV